MERELRDNRLVVDAAYASHDGIMLKIGDDMYKIIGIGGMDAPNPDKMRKIAYIPESALPFAGYEYAMMGLYPRNGYEQFIKPMKRAISEEELNDLRKKHNIDEDNISKPFEDTYRGCFGAPKEYHKQYTAVQVRVEPYDAIPLETELKEKGIHAYNGSVGRVTIRVA